MKDCKLHPEVGNLTKRQVAEYERIRQSGDVNMFDLRSVVELSDGELTREDCTMIMHHYDELLNKFGIK